MTFKQFVSALVFTVLGSAASAQATQSALVCNVQNSGGGGGWIASPIVFILETNDKKVKVLDPIILATNEQAANGKMRVRKGFTRVSWQVFNVRTRQHEVDVSYSADLNLEQKTVIVRGSLKGASNHIRGKGACRDLNPNEVKNLGNVFQG